MSNKTAKQLTIEWIEAQSTELEIKINNLTSELDKARKDYEEFRNLLDKLQDDSNNHLNQTYSQVETLGDFEEADDKFPDLEVEADDWEYVEDEDDEIPFEGDETDDDEENEEDYSSPRDWLHSKYQDLPMEDAVLEILKQCQPAKPGDVALRMYKIREDDPNFRRVKNSVNAALTKSTVLILGGKEQSGMGAASPHPHPHLTAHILFTL